MNLEAVLKLAELDTPTVSNGIELLEMRDPSGGYTGPDVRALMPEMGVRIGVAVTARLDTTSPGTGKPGSLFDDWLQLIRQAASSAGAGGPAVPVFAVIESVGPRPRHTEMFAVLRAQRDGGTMAPTGANPA